MSLLGVGAGWRFSADTAHYSFALHLESPQALYLLVVTLSPCTPASSNRELPATQTPVLPLPDNLTAHKTGDWLDQQRRSKQENLAHLRVVVGALDHLRWQVVQRAAHRLTPAVGRMHRPAEVRNL